MKTLDDMKKIFFREKMPYWSLYNSRNGRESSTQSEVMESDKETRLAASWAYLEDEVMPDLADGVYKINIMPNVNASKSKITHHFQWGEMPVATPSVPAARTAGIGNIGAASIGYIETIAGLLQSGRGDADRLRDDLMNERMEKLELKFKISGLEKDLDVAQNSKGEDDSIGSLLKGLLKENFTDILDRIYPIENTTAIATLRHNKAVPTHKTRAAKREMEEDLEEEFDEDEDGDAYEYDEDADNDGENTPSVKMRPIDPKEAGDRMRRIFEASTKLIPNHHPIEVLEEIIAMAKNPNFSFVIPMLTKSLDKKAKIKNQ